MTTYIVMDESKKAFLHEYIALCKKYSMFAAYLYDDGPYHLQIIEGDDDFWFRDHIEELGKSKVDIHKGE